MHDYDKHKDKSTFKGEDNDYDKNFDNRMLSIAAFLVKEGVRVCIEYYEANNRRTFTPVINTLNEAAGICDVMAFPFRAGKRLTVKYDIEKNE